MADLHKKRGRFLEQLHALTSCRHLLESQSLQLSSAREKQLALGQADALIQNRLLTNDPQCK